MLKNNIFPCEASSYGSTSSNAFSSSAASSKGKSKLKEVKSIIGRNYNDVDIAIDTNCKDESYDLNKCLTDAKGLLAKISNLETKVKNKFKNIEIISSEEEDFNDKIAHVYDAAKDFCDDLNDYIKDRNSYHYSPDPSRLTNAAKKYKKYLQQFEQFNDLDKQRESLQTLWETMLLKMKSKKMTKEIMQVNEIISDVTFDAFDYLNNQDHVKFKKILKDNELLYDLYCNKLKHLDLQKEKLNQLMGWLGNESREAEEDDLANNSILKKYNQLNHTSSITTSTTALFANKNICHKEKKYDRRPFLTLK